jgi:hypothetical protein
VKITDAPPYSIEVKAPVLLNSLASALPDKKTGSYAFKENQPTGMKQGFANIKAIEDTLNVSRSAAGAGVDQGAFSALSWELE